VRAAPVSKAGTAAQVALQAQQPAHSREGLAAALAMEMALPERLAAFAYGHGEEITMSRFQTVATAFEFDTDVVDLSDNSTTVYTSRCLVRSVYVNTDTSAHAILIKDGATTVFTIPASTPAGIRFVLGDAHFKTSLVVDPDDSATGSITITYKPVV
jgi:hypothetical protein